MGAVERISLLSPWSLATVAGKPRILVIGGGQSSDALLGASPESCEVVVAQDPIQALERLGEEKFDGVYVGFDHLAEAVRLGKLVENEQILHAMPDGVALLDADNVIVWCNARFQKCLGREDVVGTGFYAALGSPEILGPDYSPFHSVHGSGVASDTTLRIGENRYCHLHVAPVERPGGPAGHVIVTIRDVTAEVQQQRKMAAIHQAGTELADLTADELLRMSVEDRIELLKSNILHYTKDLLKFDVVEIRLLDRKTQRLEPLLSVGMEPDAAARVLFARPRENGVTGFVAATGKSYVCEDATRDPLYLPGAKDARSSLTVPLILHDEVLGTFNVESPQPKAFGEADLEFLEIFARDVAAALNTLELLSAEKASAAAASVEAIHSAVALPVDEILHDAVRLLEHYSSDDPEPAEGLQRILRNARDIKQVIQMVGQRMAPSKARPETQHDALRGRQILLVDEDGTVRGAVHALLARYGCNVETASSGGQALSLVRAMTPQGGYDAVIADIRLPDMSGHEFFVKLQEAMEVETPPLILATEYGYDPGHSIVKARQAGLRTFLFKPFRLDQLLQSVEEVVASPRAVATG
jgi:two-component system, sensor histidine kinase SagS